MTDQSSLPDIGRSLTLVHRVITRGLQVSVDYCYKFGAQGFPGPGTRQGFLDYVTSLLTFLEGHHLLEDKVAFPAMRSRLSDAPYDLLGEQHHQIEQLIQLARQDLAQVTSRGIAEDFEILAGRLIEIQSLWPVHIQIEEQYLTSQAIFDSFSATELVEMAGQIAAFNQQHSQPPELVIPFILHNLPAQERAQLAAGMPPAISQQMVPLVWKERWAPMQPFLLE